MDDYARRGGFAARDWLERMIRPLPRGGAILDLGCGGGEPNARYLIDQGFAVTGVDWTQPLIDLATIRFPRQRWIRADMRTVVIEEQFDAVLAWDSLTCLRHSDQDAAVTRAAHWLKCGGRLLVNAEAGAADYSAAIARCGLIDIAHGAQNNIAIWLARKP